MITNVPNSNFNRYPTTVPLMKVGTLPVTRGCSVPQTSPLVTGYQEGVHVQLVKADDRGGVRSQK